MTDFLRTLAAVFGGSMCVYIVNMELLGTAVFFVLMTLSFTGAYLLERTK